MRRSRAIPRIKVEVRLTDHADERAELRAPYIRGLEREVAIRLETLLRLGVTPGPNLDVQVPLPGGVRAVCYPSESGGWFVATILPAPDVWVETEERAPEWPVPVTQT